MGGTEGWNEQLLVERERAEGRGDQVEQGSRVKKVEGKDHKTNKEI
jgi:hypothetical protein